MNASLHANYCRVCGKAPRSLMQGRMVRSTIAEMIRQDFPDWSDDNFICLDDLNIYRSRFVEKVLEVERGELSQLEEDVVRSLKEQELISANTNAEISSSRTMGEKLSDSLASFGGSWTFLICFSIGMGIWIIINSILLATRAFDPYPFILLNLLLSCLAAIQAPVIMMSQNRQEAKDRVRAEHDYRVNLKAELEIRHLHSKMDLLLTHQWQRLLEIQQIQTELLQQLTHRTVESSGDEFSSD